MKFIFLLLLVAGAHVLANVQPQLQPPYTCTTTTTSCQPGEQPPNLVLPSSRARSLRIPGKTGPKGEKGEPCKSNGRTENAVISSANNSQPRLLKGSKGERGEKGDSCQWNETRYQELRTKLEELQAQIEGAETLTKSVAGSSSSSNSVATVTRGPLFCSNLPTKCSEVRQTGANLENVVLYPFKKYFDITPFPVNCSNGGWIAIQRRTTGVLDFNLPYRSYIRGFGKVDGEYWMGLERLHRLTSQAPYKLRIEMKYKSANPSHRVVEYGHFYVDNEDNGFRLVVGDYTGASGYDVMVHHNGMRFTAYDHDVDTYSSNCADALDGGWWYKSCSYHGLTGHYKNFFYWNDYLVSSVMMVQPRC